MAGIDVTTRIRPYPPSLSRMPARIIDPATGASTWALGSQRCVEYKGIFTKNAMESIKKVEVDTVILFICIIVIFMWEFLNITVHRVINRGSEAVIVYIIKYILACMRSGW